MSLAELLAGGGSAVWATIAIGLWVAWVAISSFLAGGYVTGRLRRPLAGASQHEVEVRDGLHGLIMWGTAALLGAMLAASAVAGTARVGAQAVAAAGEAAVEAIDGPAIAYLVDRLYRSTDGAGASVALRDETGRILAAVDGEGALDPADEAFLIEQVSARTAIGEDEARARLADVTGRLQAAAQDAAQAADVARRVGVLGAFMIAASLLIGAAAAWWAAGVGGRHRDEGTDFGRWVRWR
ncbi:MAG: hypothetical protein R3F55_06565 [Alphaproteobacteria bacterium]